MKRVSLPAITGTQRLNAEVITEVTFPDWHCPLDEDEPDIDVRRHTDRVPLRGWNCLVPTVADITAAVYGAAPGSRVIIHVALSFMDGTYRVVHFEAGRTPPIPPT